MDFELSLDPGLKQPMILEHDRSICRGDWLSLVGCYYLQFMSYQERRWLLYETDFERFSAYFFALLAAGKEVVLTANGQPERLRELKDEFELAILPNPVTGVNCWEAEPAPRSFRNLPAKLTIAANQPLYFFTSGSSGKPKKIAKQWHQLWSEVEMQASRWFNATHPLVVASVSHLHIYGLLFKLLLPLRLGLRIYAPTIEFPEQLEALSSGNTDVCFVSSPAYLTRVARYPESVRDRPHPQLIFSSGGVLPPSSSSELASLTGVAPTEIFGSTETGGIAWRRYPQTNWQPLPGVEVDAAPEEGRLSVKSPWTNGEDWFCTDDKIRFKTDGCFSLLGRVDRVIKLEEKRLSLDELESRMLLHPDCLEAKAVLLNGRRRQLAMAVRLSEDKCADRKVLIARFKNYLRDYYDPVLLPKKWRFVDVLPQDSQGKLSESSLMELFRDPIA